MLEQKANGQHLSPVALSLQATEQGRWGTFLFCKLISLCENLTFFIFESSSRPVLGTPTLIFYCGWCLFLHLNAFEHILFFYFQLELTSFSLSVTPLKKSFLSSFQCFLLENNFSRFQVAQRWCQCLVHLCMSTLYAQCLILGLCSINV